MKIRIKLKEYQDYLKMKRLSGLVIAALRQGHHFGQEIMNKSYEIKNLSLCQLTMDALYGASYEALRVIRVKPVCSFYVKVDSTFYFDLAFKF